MQARHLFGLKSAQTLGCPLCGSWSLLSPSSYVFLVAGQDWFIYYSAHSSVSRKLGASHTGGQVSPGCGTGQGWDAGLSGSPVPLPVPSPWPQHHVQLAAGWHIWLSSDLCCMERGHRTRDTLWHCSMNARYKSWWGQERNENGIWESWAHLTSEDSFTFVPHLQIVVTQ